MMSNEHGMPERATGAQGAGEAADGVSVNGGHGYSALAGGTAQAAGEPFTGTGSAAPDLSASAGGFSAAARTREYEPGLGEAAAGAGDPGQPEPPAGFDPWSPAASKMRSVGREPEKFVKANVTPLSAKLARCSRPR